MKKTKEAMYHSRASEETVMERVRAMKDYEINRPMSRLEVCAYLGIGETMLDKLPIPRKKFGRCVWYCKDEVDKWLHSGMKMRAEQVRGNGWGYYDDEDRSNEVEAKKDNE